VLLAVVLSGCAVTYLILQRLIRRSVSDGQAQIHEKLLALTGALHSLEVRMTALRESAVEDAPASETEALQPDLTTETRIEPNSEQIAPEILATITAATAAFLGQNAHVRSVKPLSAQQAVSPWSQQGRVFVQASHNLRSKR
jgi:hypothetical protein